MKAFLGLVLFAVACNGKDTGSPDTSDTADTADTDVAPDTDNIIPVGEACDPSDDDCVDGSLCCTACCRDDETPKCTAVEEGEDTCPLPDITVEETVLANGWYVVSQNFAEDDCAIVEGCVDAPGVRQLLKFDTQTPNLGNAPLHFGVPDNETLFEYSECHDHMHFTGYARYSLVDGEGAEVADGHKQAFCLMNTDQYVDGAPNENFYNCSYQGIDAGWADTYTSGLDCQWVDVTGVAPGTYTLRVEVNYEGMFPEQSYDNNVGEAQVVIVDPESVDVTDECANYQESEYRDCGWEVAESFECTPDEPFTVGCTNNQDCDADPVLRVCAGSATSCSGVEALASVDDFEGTCPQATVVCPESGVVTVLTAPYSVGDSYQCDPTEVN